MFRDNKLKYKNRPNSRPRVADMEVDIGMMNKEEARDVNTFVKTRLFPEAEKVFNRYDCLVRFAHFKCDDNALKFEVHVSGHLPDMMKKAKSLGDKKRTKRKRLKELREENKHFII